jgi:DNA polymerase delta subunit 1
MRGVVGVNKYQYWAAEEEENAQDGFESTKKRDRGEDDDDVVVWKRSSVDVSMTGNSLFIPDDEQFEMVNTILRTQSEKEDGNVDYDPRFLDDIDENVSVEEEEDDFMVDDTVDLLSAERELSKKVHPEMYQRPDAPDLDPSKDDLVFQHTETTFGICPERNIPEIRVWGVTEKGNSVCMRSDLFKPYFYAMIDTYAEANSVREKLEVFLDKTTYKKNKVDKYVLAVEPVKGRTILGWHKNRPLSQMYKFVMAHPSHIPKARDSLEFGNPAVTHRATKTFEGNVPFELRYMIDTKLNGCDWIRVKAGGYSGVPTVEISSAQIEIKLNALEQAEPIPSEKKGDLAPMRYLSFDIEVLNEGGGFPTADKCPVITIAAALYEVAKGIRHKVVFATRYSSKFEEADEIFICKNEQTMLLSFRQYIVDCDPDAFTGWNIDNFDWPYLAKRADALGVYNNFMSFSRIEDKLVWIRTQTFQSKAYGAKITNEMLCEGRFSYDGLLFMLRGQMTKYRSYKLNYISKVVLDDQKLDVDYSQIPMLYNGDDDDRARLYYYCLKDALLPLMLLEKLMAVVNGIEQARVTGVPIKWLLSRGQGVKTFSNLLRYKNVEEHTPSRTPKANFEVTGGGSVKEPKRGYYKVPLATLDFASLYPSIMIAYNICYSTKVDLKWARENLKPEDYWIPNPSVDKKTAEQLQEEQDQKDLEARHGIKRKAKSKKERAREEAEAKVAGKEVDFCFVKRHIRQGVLPLLLETLLATRRKVKGMMKDVDRKKEPLYYSVLDSRQLALKVVCNSVYGFLKAFILTDKDLMAAVTSYGRNMIYKVHNVIKTNFQNLDVVDCPKCREMGIDPEIVPVPDTRPRTRTNAFVVYGDTDSVMVNFGDITLEECARFGAQAAAICTAQFEAPNELTFETIKLRSMFLNKKRYASLEIEKIIPGEHINAAILRGKISVKGMEGKRRDNAPIGSDTQNEVIDILLKEGDVAKAETLVKETISNLLTAKVDLSKLIISKGLSKTDEQYARGGTKQQHVELKKRMQKRAHLTGETIPETGDRLPFIMKRGNTKSRAHELSEHPVYAQQKGVPIDTDYYINKQIWPAVIRIFTCIYEPLKCVIIDSSMSQKAREGLIAHQRLFSKNAKHMLNKTEPKIRGYGITAYGKTLLKCLSCGVPLRGTISTEPCCAHCDKEAAKAKVQALYDAKVQAKKVAWDICMKCQGGKFEKVSCSNMTCDNFFHRDQTILDVEDIGKDLKRFV